MKNHSKNFNGSDSSMHKPYLGVKSHLTDYFQSNHLLQKKVNLCMAHFCIFAVRPCTFTHFPSHVEYSIWTEIRVRPMYTSKQRL